MTKEICDNCGTIHEEDFDMEHAGEVVMGLLEGKDGEDFYSGFKKAVAGSLRDNGAKLDLQGAIAFRAGLMSILAILDFPTNTASLRELPMKNQAILAATLSGAEKMIKELEPEEETIPKVKKGK